jgi:hypothetical protein
MKSFAPIVVYLLVSCSAVAQVVPKATEIDRLEAFKAAVEAIVFNRDVVALSKATCTDDDSMVSWRGAPKDNNSNLFRPTWVLQTLLQERGLPVGVNASTPKLDSKQMDPTKFISFTSNVAYVGTLNDKPFASWWVIKKLNNGQFCLGWWFH